MDLWFVHVKNNGFRFFLRNSFLDKPVCWNSRNNSMALEIRNESLSNCSGYRSLLVRSMGKKNSGNSNSSSSNSPSSSSVYWTQSELETDMHGRADFYCKGSN